MERERAAVDEEEDEEEKKKIVESIGTIVHNYGHSLSHNNQFNSHQNVANTRQTRLFIRFPSNSSHVGRDRKDCSSLTDCHGR